MEKIAEIMKTQRNILLIILLAIFLIGATTFGIKIDDQGNVTIGGNLTVTGEIIASQPHLFLSFSDSIVILDMTTNNWAQITNASDSLFGIIDISNFTINADTIIFGKTGHYIVTGALTHLGATGNDIQEIRFVQDGVQCVKMETSTTNNVDHISVPVICYVEAIAGDKLWMEIRNITDNDDSEIHSGAIIVVLDHL